jgi:hypothetical protein
VMWVMWNLVLVCLETEFALVRDRCMVCVKRTIGSEIILHGPDRVLGSGIDLDAPDGTPRRQGSS